MSTHRCYQAQHFVDLAIVGTTHVHNSFLCLIDIVEKIVSKVVHRVGVHELFKLHHCLLPIVLFFSVEAGLLVTHLITLVQLVVLCLHVS